MEPVTVNPARQRADESGSLETLATETDTSLNLVKQIYTEELQALEKDAKVRTFMKVIAMRRTRQILQSLESRIPGADVH
jgi:hypothetical protein